MDAPQWLEEVRRELARHKLPPLYAERLLSELSDHITDFTEDPMSTEALERHDAVRPLGAPKDLAAGAAHEFKKRSFSARHPWLVFVGLPILVLPILWLATIATFVLLAKLLGLGSGGSLRVEQLPEWIGYGLATLVFAMVLAPIALAAWIFCRAARKAGTTAKWPLAACLILGIVGGLAYFDVALPGTHQHGLLHDTRFSSEALKKNAEQGAVTMGFGFGLSKYPRWWQIVQFAVPMTIGALAVARYSSINRRVFAS